MPISPNLHFQVILQFDLRWPLTLICDLWQHEHMKVSILYQLTKFGSYRTSNFSNEAIFTFSAYITTWPQMTFDLGTWPLTAWTYEGSHILSINQVWFKSDINFSNEAIFTFSAYLKLDFRWPLTLIYNLWPHQQMRVPMLHLWPNFARNPSKHVEDRAKC